MAYTAIVSSGTTIPASFDETSGSLLASSIPAGSRIMVLNYTARIIMVCLGEYSAAPSSTLSTTRNQIPVQAAVNGVPGNVVFDSHMVSNNARCYIRSYTTSVATGDVMLTVWDGPR